MIDGGGFPPTVEGGGVPLTVIVVGAGVSGCACAVALASEGLHVTLMNSAMDRVGLPAYGPDLIGEDGGWRQAADALRELPLPLRRVWLEAGTMPASGEAVFNVDRRKISVETKRALECVPGLQFRQGFVTDVRLATRGRASQEALSEDARTRSDGSVPGQERDRRAQGGQGAGQQAQVPDRRVQVETIFGEVFEADAVVVAAGLSLGGRIKAGTDVVHGGRYGEPASEGLRTALQTLGAEFRETALEVGPRASVRSATAQGWLTGADGPGGREDGGQIRAGGLSEEPLLPATSEPIPDCWPAGYPPAPYWRADLRVARMVMAGTVERGEARRLPALSPDGAALSEVYLRPGSVFVDEMAAVAGDEVGPIAGRMPLIVTGLTVEGVSDTGRMWCGGEPGPVWVVGRSAGAQDYAASLSSGVRAARDIAQSLGELTAAPSPISDERGQGSDT